MELRRVIVTGASGPLGVMLIRECVRRGLAVLAVVRPGSGRKQNIPEHPLVRVEECDLSALGGVPADGKYDACFHLAWMHTGPGRASPLLQAANIPAALGAAEFARRMGCEAFIGAGSQAEYGRLDAAADERTPTDPALPYGVAKNAACRLLLEYGRQTGLRVNWLRIFTVYGPYENDYVLTSYLIRTLLRGEKPELTPCGQRWDFLYCEDAARAFLAAAERAEASGVYCLGSGEARTLREYVEIIRDQVDPALPLGIGERPYADGQIMHLQADIRKLREETGFTPLVPFEEGARRTVEWYRERKIG